MNEIGKKLLTVLDAATALETTEQRSRKFLHAITRESGFVPDKAQLDEFRKHQKAYKTALDYVMRHTSEHARAAFVAQQAKHQSAALAAEAVADHFHTREQLETSFQGKMQSGKNAMSEVSLLAAPIAKALAATWIADAKKLADDLEASERASCARFGFQHSASALVTAIRAAIVQTERNASPSLTAGFYFEPRRMVEFLDL